MGDEINNNIGLLLKDLMKQHSLSMRALGRSTGINGTTISRIINGKRKANLEHLQKLADYFKVPMEEFLIAAGYSLEKEQEEFSSGDIHLAIDSIQHILEPSKAYNKKLTIESIKQKFDEYKQYSQTEEGKKNIFNGFEEKLQKVGGWVPLLTI